MKEYEQKIYNIMGNTREEIISQANQAYKRGYREGYEIGKQDGYEEGQKSLINAYAIGKGEDTLAEKVKEAYENGYEKGLDDNAFSQDDCIALLQKTGWMQDHDKQIYEHGLHDAWEAARKIAQTYAHFTCYDLNRIFGDRDSVGRKMIFEEYTPQDAIRKIKEYEDKQNNHKEIMDFCEKMGYSFDELAEVLAEMRGAEK